MYHAWSEQDPLRDALANMYQRINSARESSSELRSASRSYDSGIFVRFSDPNEVQYLKLTRQQ